MYRIAVIEDDTQLCETISQMLDKYGYEAVTDFNYRNLCEDIGKRNLHLILLDINLPYYDGYHIAQEIRRTSTLPIIMISARETESEQIRGFDAGADDYLIKPFSMEMLKVKINACIRRAYQVFVQEPDVITLGNFSVDQRTFLMRYLDQSIELTKNEFKIISALAQHYKTIVKREYLLQELWDDMTFVEDNTLNVNISRIKNKLQSIGLTDVIHTKRGEGYLFTLE